MPGAVSGGEPVPAGGALPGSALSGLGARPFAVYVHVPFCTTRCGYCDFNTYTASELTGSGSTVSASNYAELAIAEIDFARQVLGDVSLPTETVFFGGGTPTLLAPRAIGDVLRSIARNFGGTGGPAEVTVEANPESVT